LTKQLASIQLNEADILYLKDVAELCHHDYGEVVDWARGILHLYPDQIL